MFKSNHNKGFSMTFENGITISVQFGTSNYCERRNMTTSYRGDMDAATPIVESNNAEIAIWDKDRKWFGFEGGDTVKGWVDVNEVANWIFLASKVNNLEELRIQQHKYTDQDKFESTPTKYDRHDTQ